MKVKIIVAMCLLILAGCNGQPAGTTKADMLTVCLDGVTYYQFREVSGYSGFGYMSVKLGKDSKVVLCDN